MELVVYIENKFGVRFGDLEAIEIKTLYDLVLLTHIYYSEKKNKNLLKNIEHKEALIKSRLK